MTGPAKPPHDGKLGLVSSAGMGSSGRPIRHPIGSLEAIDLINDEIEQIIVENGFLDGAPFSWVTIAILFEEEAGRKTEFGRINRKYGDLPLTVQLDVDEFSGLERDAITRALRFVVIQALIDAGEKYDRPTLALRKYLAQELEE